jgi:hypothetical protein
VRISGKLNNCANPWIYVAFNSKQVRRAFCDTSKRKNVSSRKEFEQTTVMFSAVAQCDTLDSVEVVQGCNGTVFHHISEETNHTSDPQTPTPDIHSEFPKNQHLSPNKSAFGGNKLNIDAKTPTSTAEAYAARRTRLLSLQDSILLPDCQENPIASCACYIDDGNDMTVRRILPLFKENSLDLTRESVVAETLQSGTPTLATPSAMVSTEMESSVSVPR